MSKLSDLRIVDPVLTSIVLGYSVPENKGTMLFPVVTVPLRGGRVVEFNKDNFKVIDTVRAPGSATKRITVGYGSQTYALVDESLDAQVPIEELEEAANGPGIKLMTQALEDVKEAIDRNLEIAQATLATTAANYGTDNRVTLADGSRFNDAATDPGPIFEAGKEAIRAKIGRYPNKVFMPTTVVSALKANPFVQDQVKYTGAGIPTKAKITLAMLAEYIGVDEVVEMKAVAEDDATGELYDIWGFDVVMAWVNPRANNRRSPNFGYTYRLRNYPYAEKQWFDKSTKSWISGYTDARQAKITMADAGYLIKDATD